MASLECSNKGCKKMLGYDCKNNMVIVPSSEYIEDEQVDEDADKIKIDIRCTRCKRHNYVIFK